MQFGRKVTTVRVVKLFILSLILLVPSLALSLDAFPGAVGVGKSTVGGRGGAVYTVTNLNDSGTGSFREAALASGARTIVFAVSGDISLSSVLTVTNPYLTIAGQTSPGGISISGKQFNIATHDVIMRHMRIRSGGYAYTGSSSDGDSIDVLGFYWNGGNSVYNVMIDHCSFTWGTDETFSITGGATNTTIQYSLIAHALKEAKNGAGTDHAKGLMVSGKYEEDIEVSLYRNYMGSNRDRNPMLYNPLSNGNSYIVEGTNNVAYNWKGGLRPEISGDIQVNWIHNYTKEGPITNRQDWVVMIVGEYSYTPAKAMLYLLGNIGEKNTDGSQIGTGNAGEWLVSNSYTDSAISSGYKSSDPFFIEVSLPYATMTKTLATTIVEQAGATIPLKDSVDTAIEDEYKDGTSVAPVTTRTYPDDWPTYSTAGDNPTDTDSDGMPDSWESANGTNSSVADNNAFTLDASYTNIEIYMQDLAGDTGDPTFTCYKDVDGDLYSDGTNESPVTACSTDYYIAADLTAISGDCNDNNVNVNPGETEICDNGIDDDCTGGDASCSGITESDIGTCDGTFSM